MSIRGAIGIAVLALCTGCGVSFHSGSSQAPTSPGLPSASSTVVSAAPKASSSEPAQSPTPAESPTPTTGAASSAEQPASEPAAPAPTVRDTLRPGDRGDDVRELQQRLSDLGYWLGDADGTWGDLTTQAVYAVQKAAGVDRDGVAGPLTRQAVADGVRPQARSGADGVEIDLQRQLLLVVRGGHVVTILNTSTGSRVPYTEVYQGKTYRGSAVTPTGTYSVFRQVRGEDKGPLGTLWSSKYFNGGIAVHGAPFVPPYPASHGCARVSMGAIEHIWADGLMPLGSTVIVY